MFRSKLEEFCAKLLDEKGIEYKYESEKLQFASPVRGGCCVSCGGKDVVKQRTYTPDFTLADRTIIEVKGRLTSSERTKFRAIRSCNEHRRIILFFGADNKLSRDSDTRYSDWAKAQGFEYTIKELPPHLLQRKKRRANRNRGS